MTIRSTVLGIIAEHTTPQVEPDQLTNDSLLGDAGLDYLDKIEMILSLEDTLNLEISDEQAESFHSVGDVVDFCEKKKAN